MYEKILVTLDATATDRAIIEHVKKLATFMKSRVVLLHVATGAVAQWRGPDAGGEEVEEDQAYLERVRAEFEAAGIPADAELAYGEPAKEIVNWVAGKRLRPGGDEHPRTPLGGRPGSRRHRLRSAAQSQRAGAAAAGEVRDSQALSWQLLTARVASWSGICCPPPYHPPMVAQYRPRTSDRQRSGLPSAGRSGYDRRVITANQGTKHPIPSAIAHRKSCLHLRSSTRFHQRRRRGRGPSAPIEVVRAQLPSHRVGPTCGDGLLGRDASLVPRGASASHGRSPTANRWQPRRPWTTCPLQAAGLPRRRSPARRGRPWWGHPINRRRPRPRPCLTSARRIRWRLPRMPGPMFRPIGRRRASAPRPTSKLRRRASVPVPACKMRRRVAVLFRRVRSPSSRCRPT